MPSPGRLLALGVLLGVLPSLHGSATPPQQQPPPQLAAGQVAESVRSLESPSQSYALYLPSTYAPDRAWPLLMAFDPSAEGAVPVKLFREAAEKYGYIVVGSNNSRNGPTRPSAEAFDALWRDVHTRFRVDDRRIYAAGFSGAAQFSSWVAGSCQGCLAGVILSGAGFPPDHPPSPGLKFVVYAAIGHYDFNFPEMVQLRQALERDKITHHIDSFDGSHQWMPPALAQAALEWLNLQAMASGVLPRDEPFVAAQWSQRLQQAQAEEHNHDLYQAFNSYSSLAADFVPLRDAGEARAAVERLRGSPEYRRAQASLDDQVRKQNNITAPIIARMISLASNPNGEIAGLPQVQQSPMAMQSNGRPAAGGPLAPDPSGGPEMVRQQLEGDLASLRKQRERETNPEKLTVLRRAVGAVFGYAYDSGYTMLDSKNYRAAAAYFELAAFAAPKASAPMHYNAAAAYCLAGDRKQSMHLLRQAVAEGFNDRGRLEADHDFDRLRSSPEFQAVLANLAAK
jgi:dienelactone hydrolase